MKLPTIVMEAVVNIGDDPRPLFNQMLEQAEALGMDGGVYVLPPGNYYGIAAMFAALVKEERGRSEAQGL